MEAGGSPIRIRRGVVSDAPALAPFAARTFAEAFGAQNRPDDLAAHLAASYSIEQQAEELSAADVITLLAFDAELLVAYAQVRRNAIPLDIGRDASVELRRFYVHRAVQGRGVGRKLMAAARDAARELGGRRLWLSTWERNPGGIAFYEKMGFTDVGRTEFLVGTDRQSDRVLVTDLRCGSQTEEERIRRVTGERIDIVDYDPEWPALFEVEKRHLLSCLPAELIVRIEHFGSTAVPGLPAKPIVDMLVEVTDLTAVRERVVPILESQDYEYFWRPTIGDDGPPYYAWFIKRNPATGRRTHHIHMVEADFSEHWDRLLFRDYLIEHPDVADEYARLKRSLAEKFSEDRVAYTVEKTAFITSVTQRAKKGRGPA